MIKKAFEELLASVREGGAILSGKIPPARSQVMEGPEIKRIRDNYSLTQGAFATMLGISIATLRNWEQGRRSPDGPARILLQVAARHPDALWDVVKPVDKEPQVKTKQKKAIRAKAA
jgi:putative transcriptional regulator